MQSSGFSDSAVPSQEAPLRIRPLRRRLSSRCTTTNTCPRVLRRTGRGLNGIEIGTRGRARAAASATKPTPIAADRELTTRTDEPNSRAVCAAALYVLDSAAER